jgi:hypothetical protein
MRRALLITALLLLTVVVGTSLLVSRLLDPDAVRQAVEQQASVALGQPVKVGTVDWAVSVRPRAVLTDVEIGAPPAITLHRVELTTGLRALFSKRVEGADLVISGSRIVLPLPKTWGHDEPPETAAAAAADGPAALAIVSIDRLALDDIDLVSGTTHLRLDVESSLKGDRLEVSSFNLASEHTAVSGRGEFSSLRARKGEFSATAATLDLDDLLAIASGFSVAASETGTPAAAGPAPLDLRIALDSPRGRLLGIELTTLKTTMAVTRAGIALEPFSVGVFGGTVSGRLGIDATGRLSRGTLSAKAAGMDVAQLAAFAGSAGVITGRLTGQVDLHADAGPSDTVFRTAAGRGSVVVSEGTLPGLDLVGPVILAFGKPDGSHPVDASRSFSRLTGTFSLDHGVLRSRDLALASRDVDLRGEGTLRTAGAVVDLKTDLVLSEALSAQAGRDLYRYARERSRIVLPATIKGSLASPAVSIDVRAAVGRAIQNELENKIKKALEQLRKK